MGDPVPGAASPAQAAAYGARMSSNIELFGAVPRAVA